MGEDLVLAVRKQSDDMSNEDRKWSKDFIFAVRKWRDKVTFEGRQKSEHRNECHLVGLWREL